MAAARGIARVPRAISGTAITRAEEMVMVCVSEATGAGEAARRAPPVSASATGRDGTSGSDTGTRCEVRCDREDESC